MLSGMVLFDEVYHFYGGRKYIEKKYKYIFVYIWVSNKQYFRPSKISSMPHWNTEFNMKYEYE